MMSKRSASYQGGSAQHQSPEFRRTTNNRKCVVVGQQMVKNEGTVVTSGGSPRTSLKNQLTDRVSTASDKSPSGSARSSVSSSVGFEWSSSSYENKLLDEMNADVEATAAQVVKLEMEVGSIPVLKKKLEEAEREKKMISDDLSEKCEIVETMKQRLSVLHEQNSQLAHLAQKSGDSSESTLRMRNALVASLAQLKKLQAIVDELPELKSQVSTLMQENLKLKQQEEVISVNLTEGVTPLSLQEENDKLKSYNEKLKNESVQVSRSVEVLADSLEEMKRRVTEFEASISNAVPLSNHIKRLEKDKEGLYDELIQVKLSKSISHDVDIVYLENECIRLRKVNSLLQNRLDELALQSKQQKEKIVMKLFEIEVSNLKSKQFEVEKRLSDIDVHKSAEHVTHGEDSWSLLPPQFKAQLLKLHQFRLQNEQSHQVMQLILSEKCDLEKELSALSEKMGAKSLAELEVELEGYKNKLAISNVKIADLEKKLTLFSHAENTDYSALIAENSMLKSQLSVHSSDSLVISISDLKKQLSKEQHMHEVRLQKYKKLKEQNQKQETKLKERTTRYQSLASELANSVQLMKKYQDKCIDFEKDVEIVNAERESFRKEVSSLKAELEVIKAEYVQNDSCQRSVQVDSSLERLSEENMALKQRIHDDEVRLQETVEQKNSELQVTEEKLKQVSVQIVTVKESLAVEQDKHSLSLQEANVRIEQLETERVNSLKREKLEKDQLKQKNEQLSQDISEVSAKYSDTISELRTQLSAMEKECQGYTSRLDDTELRLSSILKEIDACKSENSQLLVTISSREASIRDLTSDLFQKESEVTKYKQVKAVETEGNVQLHGEIEGYKAMINSLQRQLDEAETREVEHEVLKQRMYRLERSLGDSSHDNKALLKLLHETVEEIPSLSQADQSLQDKNLQLEEQVSVLSQWNDKQRVQIEQLERAVDDAAKNYGVLVREINSKAELSEENVQLKHELKEVEIEVNSLRRQVKADVQEELQMKLEAKTQLLAVFNQHNTTLQQQVCSPLSFCSAHHPGTRSYCYVALAAIVH